MRKTAERNWLLAGVLAVCCVMTCYGGAQRQGPCPEPVPSIDSKFAPGQVWSYHARNSEPTSTITILKVESLPTVGKIVHIRVDGIRLHNCSGGPEPTQISHAPIAREALDRSVVKLLRTDHTIPSLEGYEQWRRACGGVYTITVAEVIAADEQTFNTGMDCKGSR